MLLRKANNKFDGINPESLRAYHKYHKSKTMGISVVGMTFEYNLVHGSRKIKLFLWRDQSEKFRQIKIVGNNGGIIKKKLGIHYFDCNVTGSNNRTSKYTNV